MMRITGMSVVVLSVLAFAGSAYAGNGNGNGNGSQGDTPGNSASAPGQVKKDDAQPPAAPPTTTAATTPPAAPTTTAEANTTGVKPSNETAHETHAEAQSDKTKQYGNGQTAGQIAEQNGAAGTDVLHGPGNSQPHKVAPCSGRRHEPDVHALKNHHGGSCDVPTPTPTPTPAPTPQPHPNPQPNPGPPAQPQATTTVTTTGQQPPKDPGSKPESGDAPGAVATSSVGAGQSKGVLASAQHVATLPFTGARLWIVVLAGLILIATGLALREIQSAEAGVESGHDHTDRARHAARGSGASLGGGPGR
jgi:hypothetical protein